MQEPDANAVVVAIQVYYTYHYNVDINAQAIAKLAPRTWIDDKTVLWMVSRAATLWNRRTGQDIRVLDSLRLQQMLDALSDWSDHAPARWMPKMGLYDADFWLMPWHQGVHWSLLVLCHPGTWGALCLSEP